MQSSTTLRRRLAASRAGPAAQLPGGSSVTAPPSAAERRIAVSTSSTCSASEPLARGLGLDDLCRAIAARGVPPAAEGGAVTLEPPGS